MDRSHLTTSPAKLRTVGVLGGMGPAATVDFLAKLVGATDARRDQDHVPVIVHNVPQIPDRSEAITRGHDAPFEPMLRGLRRLEAAGAQVLAIPCNTAHHWHARLAAHCRAPLLHIVDTAIEEMVRRDFRRPGLLATRGTMLSGLYQRRLREAGFCMIGPDDVDQMVVDRAILDVKAGAPPSQAARRVGERLLRSGADVLILGCSELPIALAEAGVPCIDPTAALARACVVASGAAPAVQAARAG